MSIVRGPRPTSGFYVLDKAISEDQRLGWAARGLLIYLLGKPDHWQVSIANLVNQTASSRKPSRRDAIYSILAELETVGYLVRRHRRQASGSFAGVDYVVSELPLTDRPDAAVPHSPDPTQARTDDLVKTEREQRAGEKKGLETETLNTRGDSDTHTERGGSIIHDKSLHGKDYARGATADDRIPRYLQ